MVQCPDVSYISFDALFLKELVNRIPVQGVVAEKNMGDRVPKNEKVTNQSGVEILSISSMHTGDETLTSAAVNLLEGLRASNFNNKSNDEGISFVI